MLINRLAKTTIIFFFIVGGLQASNFFKYSTIYFSYEITSPLMSEHSLVELDDNYSLTFGLRKIARYEYQERLDYYTGDEENISDNATIGAVPSWEYLLNLASVRINGSEFNDTKFWIRNVKDHIVYKFKYYDIGSRNLEFIQSDIRYRLNKNGFDFTTGIALIGHSAYGYDAFSEYDDYWWILARDYGYTDYMVPLNDLNGNGEIDDYYIWIETDPDTEEGYWEYYYEGTNYYWEDPDGDYIAGSDDEFHQYHMPNIIQQYNDEKIDELGYQSSVSLVIGFDYYFNKDKFYLHTWTSMFPISKGLTDYAFVDDMKYEVGLLFGYKFGKTGIYLETNYLNMFKEQFSLATGINWRF